MGKALAISPDVRLRALEVHELGLGFPKVHEGPLIEHLNNKGDLALGVLMV